MILIFLSANVSKLFDCGGIMTVSLKNVLIALGLIFMNVMNNVKVNTSCLLPKYDKEHSRL